MLRRSFFALVTVAVLTSACAGSDDAAPETTPTLTPTVQPSTTVVEATTVQPSTTLDQAVPTTTSTPTSTPEPSIVETTTVTPDASGELGYEIVTLAPDAEWHWLEAGVSDDGELFVVYISNGELKLLRCSDLDCTDRPDVKTLGNALETWWFDAAVRADGAAAVVYLAIGDDEAGIFVCDPDSPQGCFGSVGFGDNEPCDPCESSVDFMEIAVTPDGLPRIAYYNGTKLKLAICEDPSCNVLTSIVIDETPDNFAFGAPEIHIGPDGKLYIAYSRDRGPIPDGAVSEALVAVCADPSCVTGPIIFTFDDAGIVFTSHHTDTGFLVWTKTGLPYFPPEFAGLSEADMVIAAGELADIEVAECDIDGCTEPQRVPIGEDWLFAAGSLELVAIGDDATAAVFNHHSTQVAGFELQVTTCRDAICSDATTNRLGITDVAVDSIAAVKHPDSPLRIVYINEDGTLNLIKCDDDTCATPISP